MRHFWGVLSRQRHQMLAGQGVRLDRATLGYWVRRAAWWLRPLYEKLLRHIRSRPVVFCDETPLPRLDPGRGRTKTCQLWSQAVDERPWQGPSAPAVAYVYAEGRQTAEVQRQLSGFSGILQVDGYQAYKSLAKPSRSAEPIQLAFCMAHARRKFVDVYATTKSAVAQEVISRIAALYALEARINGQPAPVRHAVRQAEARPILEALRPYLLGVRAQISTQAGLAGAIGYMLNHWDGLCAYLEDGRIAIDSNVVERSMRPIGVGRRNSLFAGSAAGGEYWAILSSLINSAKLNGIDPQTYIADVLERLVSGEITINRIEELLPWAWKATREANLLERAA
ncbi:IS66 family transposase [Niveispirillum cyanobacteriorum]|uniref:IS66 family transposase n=1 Tax=Niveispirillum cyanobacteriorum TaxID=1612173 RepID=UPI00248CBA0D|nr:IS66 family transposase [Niveispirillum cyanobacteriorum]